MITCILGTSEYKPGDPPPKGYLNWHAWAEVQRKAGIKQRQCSGCGLWYAPQELNGAVCFDCRKRCLTEENENESKNNANDGW